MGLIDIIKPPSTVLSSAINKSKQHLEKNYRECRESNLGLLGEKQVCYLCAMQPPSLSLSEVGVVIFGVGGVVVVVFLRRCRRRRFRSQFLCHFFFQR